MNGLACCGEQDYGITVVLVRVYFNSILSLAWTHPLRIPVESSWFLLAVSDSVFPMCLLVLCACYYPVHGMPNFKLICRLPEGKLSIIWVLICTRIQVWTFFMQYAGRGGCFKWCEALLKVSSQTGADCGAEEQKEPKGGDFMKCCRMLLSLCFFSWDIQQRQHRGDWTKDETYLELTLPLATRCWLFPTLRRHNSVY